MLSNAYFLQNFVLIQPRTSPPKICKINYFRKTHFSKMHFSKMHFSKSQLLADCGWPPGPAWVESIFRKCIFRKCIFRKCIFEKCIFRKCIFRKFCKFLAGSFSAVSKRNFARKYAFDSIFQALQDLHPFAPLQSQIFRKKSV